MAQANDHVVGGQPGVVEVAVKMPDLRRLADQVTGGGHRPWAAVIAEIAQPTAGAGLRHDVRGGEHGDPLDDDREGHGASGPEARPGACPDDGVGLSSTSRFARGRLRRWILTRERVCTHPSCGAPASGVDVDHSVDHADGGKTNDADHQPIRPSDRDGDRGDSHLGNEELDWLPELPYGLSNRSWSDELRAADDRYRRRQRDARQRARSPAHWEAGFPSRFYDSTMFELRLQHWLRARVL